MKRLSLLVLACCNVFPIFGQLKPVYSFQKDDIAVRKTYGEESIKKKQTWIAGLDKKYAGEYKKVYQTHFEQINKLWESNRVVTDPAAHGYLQSLVGKIKAANPELQNTDARIVFSRDWWPNAYSMGDGSIAINAGLFVYLDNEAELIFILCHEIAHYYLDHTNSSIKKYVETVNSDEVQKELKRLSKTQYRVNQQLEELTKAFTFNSRRHSRERETEADRMAFQFMRNTGYDCNAIESCLRLLDKIDESSLFTPLELPQVFNFENYPFKKSWIQQESSIFSQANKDDSPKDKRERDSLKTHPDCEKRIAMLQDSICSKNGQGLKFMVDENRFQKLKKDFLAEMTEQCYRDKNYGRNLYFSLLLLQSEEFRPFAIYSVARCLKTIYEEQRDHQLGKKLETENSVHHEDYNLLLRLLSRVRLHEIASIGYHYCQQHEDFMKEYSGFAEIQQSLKNFTN